MTLPLPSRFFEDLVVGERKQSDCMTVSQQEILDFARRYDPQWFHCDPERAKQSFFGEVVASGLHTAALWRILDHQINGDIAWVCGVAWEHVRWHQALRADDEICASSEILSLRPSASQPDRGVCTLRCAVLHRSGATVMSFESVNLVYRRHALAALFQLSSA
jgi:acyl dehydratase